MASYNLLEGTLPNLVNSELRALYLSGVAGRSGGSVSLKTRNSPIKDIKVGLLNW